MDFKVINISELDGKSREINKNSETFRLFSESSIFSHKWESYFNVYDKIFSPYKNKEITFVEVGVSAGGSLSIWRKFFGNKARIIGIDLNPDAKKLEDLGFEIYIGNQSDEGFWKNFYQEVGKIDILLDDGGHKNIQQINSVHNSIDFIKDGGLIVVEDTHTSYLKEFKNPSYFSFLNYCYRINKLIHKRCEHLHEIKDKNINKIDNNYTKKIYSISFYESITVLNIDSRKCFKSSCVSNSDKWSPGLDHRNNEYFSNVKNYVDNKLNFLNKIKITRKIIRKLLYKNSLFSLFEKFKILQIFKKMNK